MSLYGVSFISEIDLIPLMLTFISSLCIGIEVNIILNISEEFLKFFFIPMKYNSSFFFIFFSIVNLHPFQPAGLAAIIW
jgi:hypothetical protein